MISANNTFLDVPGVLGWTPRVTRVRDGTAVAVAARMLVSAGHFDARGATDWSGVNATDRTIHPVFDFAKVLTDADVPGFHPLAARPSDAQQLVMSGTGVNAAYGSNAPAAFDYATRALRSGYAYSAFAEDSLQRFAACFEDPDDVGSFQPSITPAIHDSGSGVFNTDGDLLGIVRGTFYIGGTPSFTGYPDYTDTSDLNPIGGADVVPMDLVRHWVESGYSAASIACVEVLYTGAEEAGTPTLVRVYYSHVGTGASATGTAVVNFNGSAYRNTAAPTLTTTPSGTTIATYALSAGGTLPAANCCTIAVGAFTRTSDSATSTAATNLRYFATRIFGDGGGSSLGSPKLRGDGFNSEADIYIFLSNAAGDHVSSTFRFDRNILNPADNEQSNGVMFRGLFNEGWSGQAQSLDPSDSTIVRINSSGFWNRNTIVPQSSDNVGTPAGQGVVNINGTPRTAMFVTDGGDGTASCEEYQNLRASFAAPNIALTDGAGATASDLSIPNNRVRYMEVTASTTGVLNVALTDTSTATIYTIRVSRLDSVAPLTMLPDAEAVNGPLSGVPVVAGGRYCVAIRNLSGSTLTIGATLANTEAPPAATSIRGRRVSRTARGRRV